VDALVDPPKCVTAEENDVAEDAKEEGCGVAFPNMEEGIIAAKDDEVEEVDGPPPTPPDFSKSDFDATAAALELADDDDTEGAVPNKTLDEPEPVAFCGNGGGLGVTPRLGRKLLPIPPPPAAVDELDEIADIKFVLDPLTIGVDGDGVIELDPGFRPSTLLSASL
jgi:hypothetical protein